MAKFSGDNNDETSLQLEAREVVKSFGFVPQKASLPDASGHTLLVSALSSEGKDISLFLKWSERRPDFEIWLYLQLLTNEFKLVPHFYKTETSEIAQAGSGKYWTCQDYIACKFAYDWLNFNCSLSDCFRAGETLACLHAAGTKIIDNNLPSVYQANCAANLLAGFGRQFELTIERFKKESVSENIQPENKKAEAWQTKDSLHQCRHQNSPDQYLPGLSAGKKDGCHRAKESNSYPAGNRPSALELLKMLPFESLLSKARRVSESLVELERDAGQTVNHGDFHPGNLLFADDSVLGLVDWDYACSASNVYDLSYALLTFCLESSENKKQGGQLFSRQKTEAFLDGYCLTGSRQKNLKHLDTYTEFVHLLMLDWVLLELCKPKSVSADHPGFLNLAQALVCCCL